MKRKYLALGAFLLGIGLLCLSFILPFVAASHSSIIGGAGLPTFLYLFRHEHGGLYVYLAFGGALLLLVSAVLWIMKKKK